MKKPSLILIALSLVSLASSCSILDSKKADALELLDRADPQADQVQATHSPRMAARYNAGKARVAELVSNLRIAAQGVSAEPLPFAKLDASLSSFDKKKGFAPGSTAEIINAAIAPEAPTPPQSTAVAAFVADLLNKWRANSVNDRKDQAAALSKQLDGYLWKNW